MLRAALKEDLGREGDLTTRFFVPSNARLRGKIAAREPGVVCGLEVAAAAFKACEPRARVRALVRDGARVKAGQAVMTIEGGRGILTAERTALNFLQRMSGVATLTRRFADAARGTRAKILDTRKTLPGWRALDKYAVACGGGVNHRLGLYDAVMVKDNHYGGKSLAKDVALLRREQPGIPLIIECDSSAQVKAAISLKPDVILLDNMGAALLRREIKRIRTAGKKILIEISGGINLNNIRGLARLGPDRISVGAITHSAPALDLGLDLA
ncbi:MAG: carboxylating nicotinate-nucleotide diphosphorylase [Elusimicrobia bacterium]|nr:carboxylating nicotinate-nucleotide diphosphorylase [Elusimicrobiota bacterium]